VNDNRKLAEFELRGIPAMPAGLAKVQIAFKINADGILSVEAKELRSGVTQSIEVKPQYGLTDQEVEDMLMSSIVNAKQDVAARALQEAITEAEQLAAATKNFLQKHQQYITSEEAAATNNAIEAIHVCISTGDKTAIHAATEHLNNLSRPYAERVMDVAVAAALKGQNI
jgi:molecular chaperone HscA